MTEPQTDEGNWHEPLDPERPGTPDENENIPEEDQTEAWAKGVEP